MVKTFDTRTNNPIMKIICLSPPIQDSFLKTFATGKNHYALPGSGQALPDSRQALLAEAFILLISFYY